MTDRTDPGRTPGERRLDRPPSERYAPLEPAEGAQPAYGSIVRATVYADLAGLAGAAAIVVSAGVLAIGAGLLVIAAAVGRFVGLAVVAGGGEAVPPRAGVALAIIVALVAVGLGQLGTWLYARAEGGVLELVDYLAQAFGLLVPAQFAIAAAVAWWTAR